MKNILHISDIHVSETLGMNQHELKKLLDSLMNDLDSFQGVDLLLITGDIANFGLAAEYDLFKKSFLEPLLAKLSLDFSRVVITPGNHDTIRKAWKESDKSIRDNITSNPDQLRIEGILTEMIQDVNYKRTESFLEFRDEIDTSKKKLISNPIFSVYEIDGVGFGSINSAWLAYEDDREKLIVGEWQIKEILKHLKPYQQKVLVLHHPTDWLHPHDRKIISDLIHQAGIKCIFYGHMHEFSMLRESQFADDSILKLQAGRFDISKNDDFGGYSILKLHENAKFENGRIIFRKYDLKNEKFVPWTERAKNGGLDYSLDDSVSFNTAAFAEICESKISVIEYDLLCNTGLDDGQRKKLSEIFILPTLAFDDETLIGEEFDNAKNKTKTTLSLDSLRLSSQSHIILGAENSGKTIIAKRILLNHLLEQSHENLQTIVYYLDLNNANLNSTNQIKNQLLSFYTDDDNATIFAQRLEKKLNSADAVIVFDSLDALDKDTIKVLAKYIVENKHAKFYMFGQLTIKAALVELIADISNRTNAELKFNFISVKSLQRSQVRDLFEKWTPCSNGENEKSIINALRVIDSAGMPNNPFVYTMLLSISERKSATQKNYMHEADLVENFIESILHKHVAYINHDTPQYKDILLFLGFIADKMHQNLCYSRTKNDLRSYAIDFNKLIFQNFDIENYISPLTQSGILKPEKDGYIFSQVCFFNYAYANWINKEELLDYKTLDDSLNFIRFDKVIEYLSALKKSDLKLLEYLNGKVSDAWTRLLQLDGLADITNAGDEISKAIKHDLIDMISHEKMESSLIGNHKSKQEVDDILDEEEPLSDQPLMEIKPEDQNLEPSVYFYESLSLYARTFRAAEHILDRNATSSHFKNVLDFYMKSLAYTVRVFDQQTRPLILKKVTSIIKFDEIESINRKNAVAQIEAFITFVIAFLPHTAVSMMSSDFFNQRQLPKIRAFRDEISDNLSKILLTFCLCELDGIDIIKEVKSQSYEKSHEVFSLLINSIMLSNFDFSMSSEQKNVLMKFAISILKSKKELKTLENFAAISNKMAKI